MLFLGNIINTFAVQRGAESLKTTRPKKVMQEPPSWWISFSCPDAIKTCYIKFSESTKKKESYLTYVRNHISLTQRHGKGSEWVVQGRRGGVPPALFPRCCAERKRRSKASSVDVGG